MKAGKRIDELTEGNGSANTNEQGNKLLTIQDLKILFPFLVDRLQKTII